MALTENRVPQNLGPQVGSTIKESRFGARMRMIVTIVVLIYRMITRGKIYNDYIAHDETHQAQQVHD